MSMNRRSLIGAAGLALATPALKAGEAAEAAKPAAKTPPPHVTKILAQWILGSSYDTLPDPVRRESVRSVLNWVGVAIGGSHHETVDVAVSALQPFSGPPQAGLFGRTERFDILNAAFLNGVSSHIFDFDDTHLKTIIHPAGPVASAILAYAEMKRSPARPSSTPSWSGSRPSAGSAMPSTRTITMRAGTSPAPAGRSAPRRPPAS